ncbi:DUF726 domain-containing protein [Pseudahrensia aquimaris]|uniref:DUF726 domain-containing protein n=1 Tax=Pseudahrensia aquimaris TaxID=744461 RepID=A0ABW3FAJ6_9HYPH
MIRYICIILFSFFAALSFFSAPSHAQKVPLAMSETETDLAARKVSADVYLLRGFGNVFSRGLDEMSAKLQKQGVPAKVAHHSEWKNIADQIAANRRKFGRRPVVLIGHSLGANAVLRMAQELRKKRITVQYMATFAATAPPPVPSNVRKLTNYYFKTDGWGKPIAKGKGFRGNLKNIDFSKSKTIGHFNIDKQPRLQRQVIRNVLRFVKGSKRANAEQTDDTLLPG